MALTRWRRVFSPVCSLATPSYAMWRSSGRFLTGGEWNQLSGSGRDLLLRRRTVRIQAYEQITGRSLDGYMQEAASASAGPS